MNSGGVVPVAAQVIPGEHRVPELTDASRRRRPIAPEALEEILAQDPLDHPLDRLDDLHAILL
jgi:hypothetical protein